jgi:hypothetical protein
VCARDLQRLIHSLTLEQKRLLERLLQDSISKDELKARRGEVPQKGVRADGRADKRTYRFEGVRCEKEGCRCSDGNLHGHSLSERLL